MLALVEDLIINKSFSTTQDGELAPSTSRLKGLVQLPDDVIRNRVRFAENLGTTLENTVWLSQQDNPEARSNVFSVTHRDAGKGSRATISPLVGHGAVTDCLGVGLAFKGQDCILALFEDPVARVVGGGHATWRSLGEGIFHGVLDSMFELGADPRHICVKVGPSLKSACGCFEFDPSNPAGQEIMEMFDPLGAIVERPGDKPVLDSERALRQILVDLGVQNQNIVFSQTCTKCNVSQYSYRGQGQLFSNNVAMIVMH